MAISIHASAREATVLVCGKCHTNKISIHASAREATALLSASRDNFDISIHASAREATTWTCGQGKESIYFNPRLREGGDRIDY